MIRRCAGFLNIVITSVTLRVERDHLVADVPPESLEIPFDLSRATPVPHRAQFIGPVNGYWCDSESEVSMGPVHARLCHQRPGADSMAHLVAWDRDESPASQAPDGAAPHR